MHIVGGMSDKIKNNVKQPTQQFSWKLAFPKGFSVGTIPQEDIALLNEDYLRLRCGFDINTEENAILVSPQTAYKPGHMYFFWVRYSKKDFCVAFSVTEDGEMQTFDQKTSLQKLKDASDKYAAKLAKSELAAAADGEGQKNE